MSVARDHQSSYSDAEPAVESTFDRDTVSFLASLTVHVGLLLALGYSTYFREQSAREALTIIAPVEETIDETKVVLPKDFFVNDRHMAEVGANSSANAEMALSAAEILSDISDVPSPAELTPVDIAKVEVNNVIEMATGLRVDNLPVRGAAGEGTTGAVGAIDRITQDILLSLEERKTLVVWLFDQSGSLTRQRAEINARFDRIYHELGVIEAAGNPAFKRHDDKPLLTSVVGFGQQVNVLIDKPTDNLTEIKEAVGLLVNKSTC